MKILLINPPYPSKVVGFKNLMTLEPVALEYVGAILKKAGHEVKLIDAVIDNNILKVVKEFNPQVVSCTCFYIHMNIIKEIYSVIKDYDPSITTIVAGSHATQFPKDYYNIKEIDIINSGEDLLVVSKLINAIENGELEKVEGIHYRTESGWKEGKMATRCVSIDELPFPDRTLTKEYHKNYFWYFENEVASVWGSVGCPFKCYYCTQWFKNGGRFVARTPKSLVDEIMCITQEKVFIIDDNTFTNRERAKEIIELIKKNNIKKKFMCYCSPNLVIENRDILEEWRRYGLEKVMVGFESFRRKDLDDVNRKTSIETNNTAIRILKEIGIDTMAGFIVYPDFTKEDFKFLRSYIKKQRLYYAEFTSLTPFPGTLFYEQVKEKVKKYDPELFDMQHILLDTTLPLKEYYYQVMLTYLATHMPQRAFRAKLNFKISLNPFHPIYKNFIKFLWNVKQSYKDNEEYI